MLNRLMIAPAPFAVPAEAHPFRADARQAFFRAFSSSSTSLVYILP